MTKSSKILCKSWNNDYGWQNEIWFVYFERCNRPFDIIYQSIHLTSELLRATHLFQNFIWSRYKKIWGLNNWKEYVVIPKIVFNEIVPLFKKQNFAKYSTTEKAPFKITHATLDIFAVDVLSFKNVCLLPWNVWICISKLRYL